MKATEALMASKIIPYLEKDVHRLGDGYQEYAEALRKYHEIILRYEAANAIAAMVAPAVEQVATVLRNLEDVLGKFAPGDDLPHAQNTRPINADKENAVKKRNEETGKKSLTK